MRSLNKSYPMLGALWNVRGLNKEGRLQCITDFVNENKLDFVGFQETKKKRIFRNLFLNTYIENLTGSTCLLITLLVVYLWGFMKGNLRW